MRKISFKIFIVIFLCSVFSVMIIGALSLTQSVGKAEYDAHETLSLMAKGHSGKLSSEFEIIEEKIKEIGIFIEDTIDFKKLQTNRDYLMEYEPLLDEFIKYFSENRADSKAGWVYFNPKWSENPHDVYYVDGDGDGISERQEHIPFTYFDNTPVPGDDKQWWYGPIETGEIFWTNPDTWEIKGDESISVLSCAVPLYIEGELVCVYGTYYEFQDIYNAVTSIRAYENGYAVLFNEKLDAIIHPEFKTGTRFTSDNLMTVWDGAFAELGAEINQNTDGVTRFTNNGVEKIMAYSKLSNGWTMGIVPPLNEIYAGVAEIVKALVIAMIICVLTSLIVAVFMGKYLSRPILKLADAAKMIGTGDLSVKVDINTSDETKQLADSLNSMTENIASLQEELIKQAYFDELTGIKNLRKFKLDVGFLINRNPNTRYALVKLDIEKFKMLNELYGFKEGDNILKNFAIAIEHAIDRDFDTLARINADEFITLISYNELKDIEVKKQKFENEFQKLNKSGIKYNIKFKEGRHFILRGESDVDDMFEKVNLAHRLAKQSDTERSYLYDDKIKQIAKRERQIEDTMEAALERGEFKLYLQSKFNLSNEKIGGAEALVRWENGDGKILNPGKFIPIFERNGFITRLDFYMLEESCKLIRQWMDRGIAPTIISVNFSRRHIGNAEFTKKVCEIIDKHSIPREFIEIELTETAMLANDEILGDFLGSLHKSGVSISIDDFGIGYSSLSLLKNMPIDVVKLDRGFFVDAEDEDRAFAVIESIIGMTKRLNIKTVAEGVEEKKYVDLLKALGCDMVQGFFYSEPIPAKDFTKVLINNE